MNRDIQNIITAESPYLHSVKHHTDVVGFVLVGSFRMETPQANRGIVGNLHNDCLIALQQFWSRNSPPKTINRIYTDTLICKYCCNWLVLSSMVLRFTHGFCCDVGWFARSFRCPVRSGQSLDIGLPGRSCPNRKTSTCHLTYTKFWNPQIATIQKFHVMND